MGELAAVSAPKGKHIKGTAGSKWAVKTAWNSSESLFGPISNREAAEEVASRYKRAGKKVYVVEVEESKKASEGFSRAIDVLGASSRSFS